MRPLVISLVGALLVHFAACEEIDNTVDYREYSFIDTVLAVDTILNNALAAVVHVYPAGCNHLQRIESRERADTLEIAALYHFYATEPPCAHGSGLDTTDYALHFSSSGRHFLAYRRNDTTRVLQPVFVE